MAINCFSIRPEVTMVNRFWNSVITWLPSSWETWRNSRQCTGKRHLWRLLEQHWPPWARVHGRWGSRFPGDVWDVLYTMVYWIILVYWYTSMFGRFVWENFAPLDLRENCFWHQICVKQNQWSFVLALNVVHVCASEQWSRNSFECSQLQWLVEDISQIVFMFLLDFVIL